MPCMDGGYSDRQSEEAIRKLDEVTDFLCSICRAIEDRGLSDQFFSMELKGWWLAHQVADAIRKKRMEEDRQEKQDKKAALNKLSPYERNLLGL